MNQDIHNNMTEVVAFNGQTINTATTTNGAIIDTQFYNALEFIISLDAYSAGTVTPNLQEGNDPALADAASVDTNYVLGNYSDVTTTLSAANTVARLGYVGKMRYVRLQLISASSPNFYAKATAILGHPHIRPTGTL